MMRPKFICIAFFFLIIFAGCSIKETVKNIPDEEMLKERGTLYWGYICRQEFDKAYEVEYPVYRKTVSLVNYIRRFRPDVTWKNATIEKIDLEKEKGTAVITVMVDTDIKVRMSKVPKQIDITPRIMLQEKWVKVGGVWFHVPQQFIGNEAGKEV
jgi:hypothetical protein